MSKGRVLLAMSGGVDSSVAAHLLLRAGYEVVGAFMRHGDRESSCPTTGQGEAGGLGANGGLPVLDTPRQGCCSAEDANDARRIADELEIPFYALNLQEDFDRIIDYFTDEYLAGRTPNPCIMCNNWLKFGRLFAYADSIDADYVATGHYARCENEHGTVTLRRGHDRHKDQSYVLFGINRNYLSRVLLPIGDYRKAEIRKLADEFGMRVAAKRDSQEICFVAPGEHADFVARRRGDLQTEGDFISTSGEVLGRHAGIERFTVGQRKGLGIALGEPHYVVRIDATTRQVVLGKRDELACDELTADRVNWLVEPPATSFQCDAQIRYNSPASACRAEWDGQQLRVAFAEPRHGVAPGQAVVLYRDDVVLGGGWIRGTRSATLVPSD